MRSYSTPESAQKGEVTKLAIVEAFASVALYVAVCTYLRSWQSLAVIVIGAPLMLFRTEIAVDWALGYWERWTDQLDRILKIPVEQRPLRVHFRVVIAILGFILVTPFVGICLRFIGTVYWAVRMPLYTLREAPRNWLRQTLCTDFMHPPEIVPMEIVKRKTGEYLLYADLVGVIRSSKSGRRLLVFTLYSPIVLFGYLPSAAYRVSFKATSIVYAPFIWAAHATARTPLPLKVRLERITKGELEKVRRGFSWIVLGVFAAKTGFVLGLVDPKKLTEKFTTAKAAELFLVPEGWPWWQLTLATDAVLTFVLLFFADAALARFEGGHPWPEQTVLDVTAVISFLRVTLSLLTIAHFFGLALRIAFPAVAWL